MTAHVQSSDSHKCSVVPSFQTSDIIISDQIINETLHRLVNIAKIGIDNFLQYELPEYYYSTGEFLIPLKIYSDGENYYLLEPTKEKDKVKYHPIKKWYILEGFVHDNTLDAPDNITYQYLPSKKVPEIVINKTSNENRFGTFNLTYSKNKLIDGEIIHSGCLVFEDDGFAVSNPYARNPINRKSSESVIAMVTILWFRLFTNPNFDIATLLARYNIQLIGYAVLFIASKLEDEEGVHITADDLSKIEPYFKKEEIIDLSLYISSLYQYSFYQTYNKLYYYIPKALQEGHIYKMAINFSNKHMIGLLIEDRFVKLSFFNNTPHIKYVTMFVDELGQQDHVMVNTYYLYIYIRSIEKNELVHAYPIKQLVLIDHKIPKSESLQASHYLLENKEITFWNPLHYLLDEVMTIQFYRKLEEKALFDEKNKKSENVLEKKRKYIE
jgi:hypothetical protein